MMIYLDNAATTKPDPKVLKAMRRYNTVLYGNPSSIHKFGKKIRSDLEKARETIARTIGAYPEEIYFTSGGTESNNLVIMGIVKASGRKKCITSKIEHASVLETFDHLEKEGYKVVYLDINKQGIINLDQLKKELTKNTAIVSIMHANNEMGAIQPIEKISRLCKEKNVPFHIDCVQSYTKLPINVSKLHPSAISISSHKIHGPKGVGALYLERGTKFERRIFGGGQESNLRSGTENVPGIIGFATAATLNPGIEKMTRLRDKLISKLQQFGNLIGSRNRLPNNVSFTFPGTRAIDIVNHLSRKNIFVSGGSACKAKSLKGSHVLLSMGLDPEQGGVRLTLSKETTEEEIDEVILAMQQIVSALRKVEE